MLLTSFVARVHGILLNRFFSRRGRLKPKPNKYFLYTRQIFLAGRKHEQISLVKKLA
jgi:hypothetical protein